MTLFSPIGLETMPGITVLELLMFPCPELDVDHLTGLWINSLPGWLTQLRLFLSGSPITISHSKQSSAPLPMLPHAKIWGDLLPPLQPPKPDLCSKRSLFEVKKKNNLCLASVEPDVFQCFLRLLKQTKYSSQTDPSAFCLKVLIICCVDCTSESLSGESESGRKRPVTSPENFILKHSQES